jgi:hypothetical protein
MKPIAVLTVLMACTALAPVAAQERPGLVERGKQGVKWLLDLLLKSRSEFLDEVESAMRSDDLGKEGESRVIKLNTRLATLRTGDPAGLPPAADTPVHEVNHLENCERFLDAAVQEAMDAIAWKILVDAETAELEKYAEDAPKKGEAVREVLERADEDLRGMRGRLSRNPTLEDVRRERRLLARIRTTLRNTARVLTSEVERAKEWLSEVEKSGESHPEGLARIKRFQSDTVEGKAAANLLPAVVERVRQSVATWTGTGEVALLANLTAWEAARKELDPFENETLLEDIPSFEDVEFDDLPEVVKPHEEYLKELEDRLKAR